MGSRCLDQCLEWRTMLQVLYHIGKMVLVDSRLSSGPLTWETSVIGP